MLSPVDAETRGTHLGHGFSGSRIERVTTTDGRVLVVKTEDPRDNWVIQSTGDAGRIVQLWSSGILGRLPAGVDCAIEDVVELPVGWRVVMRDVTDSLLPSGRPLTRAQSRAVLTAAASVHDVFAGLRTGGLCSLVDRFACFTPSAVQGVARHPLRARILGGWERFIDLAPGALQAEFLRLLARPGALAAALRSYPATLLHGDLKVASLGIRGRQVVMLGWGSLTGIGPRAVDHAWYIAINGAAVDASLDELHADTLAILGRDEREALPLALLGSLLQLGWDKAFAATGDDPATRERELAGLRWWWRRAREALEIWSPG